MRNALARELVELAGRDERIVLLSGDIGNRMFDGFKDRFPDRFFNCGVAEANMMSVAAGMALSGLRPVVYTIAPFVTTRCLEQIRVDVCYHRVPVVIVGVGGGLSYANLGATHHSCEDIAFLRVLPHMSVVCPGDACETRLALRAAIAYDDPVYLRIGKKGEPVVHKRDPLFEIGKGITISSGEDVTLLSTGNMLPIVVEAAELIQREGLTVWVVSLHTVKPLDEELLAEVFSTSRVVVTVEEHTVLGGLGGAVAEWLTNLPVLPNGRLLRIGTPDAFLHEAADQSRTRSLFGLDAEAIAQKTLDRHRTIVSHGSVVNQ
jgi:transketolase